MPHLLRPAVLVPLVVLAVAAGTVGIAVPALAKGGVTLDGLGKTLFDPAALKTASVSLRPGGDQARLLIDGKQVAAGNTGTLTARLAGLSEGRHTVVAELDRGFPLGTATTTRSFTVDATPPALTVMSPTKAVAIKDAVTVTGTVEQGATVRADGGVLKLTGTAFTISYKTPPASAKVVATDPAGNQTTRLVTVPTAYPQHIRAVHMTGAAWAYAPLREPVLAMIREHRINAVQLDIKDEEGIINYPSQVPIARQAGATATYYDARKVTGQLHALGVRVIGRIVAFNDSKLASYAQARGHRDWFIQNPNGTKYLYGYSKAGFTNFANPNVRAYNEAIAVEAVKSGFDDIVYDYVRRPDGKLSGMRFPGLRGNPEDAIVNFLQETQAKIRPLGGSLGAAAFGQASTRPRDTAQNIPKMAKYLDVVIPMDYPSHWNPGEYGVADPYTGMFELIKRSLVDWNKDVVGTNCVVVPWLQDENYKGVYTADKVRQQIMGARANKIPGWLMWSAGARYTPAAYSPDATPAR